ncbi:hypothetical protein JST97_20045 [bacterium]|nr:hypothetical protein [bacterium]
MAITLRFRMNLSEFRTQEFLLGTLSVLDDNAVDTDHFLVSSGLPNFQFQGAEALRKRGPIPRCRFAGVANYEVWTDPTFQPETIGVEGTFYNIDPLSVVVNDGFSGDSISRSEFGIHFDHNVPGSAGCIVFQRMAEYRDYERLMANLRNSGIQRVNLDVDYNVHEKTWTVIVKGDQFKNLDTLDGTVFLPVRQFAERFTGATVGFDPATSQVTLNGAVLSPIRFLSGTAFAPLRKMAAILRATVTVNGSVIDVS